MTNNPTPPHRPFRIGPWRVDPARRRITGAGREVALRPKPMALLLALVGAAPGVLTRDAAMEAVWPGVTVGDESLTHAASELRRAFGQTTRGDGPIETIQKGGYRLRQMPEAESVRPRGPVPGAALIDARLAAAEARRLRDRNGVNALAEALDLCRKAAALAPDDALVLAEAAMAAADCTLFSARQRPDLGEAMALADRAVACRPDLACGHVARGFVLDAAGCPEAATEAFARAITLSPGDADAHYLMARMFYASGDLRRAALAAAEAARLMPDDYCAPYLAAGAFAGLGETSRAGEAARQALARLKARREIDGSEPRADNILAPLLARAGQPDAALTEVTRYEAAGGIVTYYNAAAYAGAGDVTLALDRLEENLDTGYRNFRWIQHDPALAPLRREKRFQRLLDRAS